MRYKHGNKNVVQNWRMRKVHWIANEIWAAHGKELVITSPPDMEDYEHGPFSWHYYGMATDLRSTYFSTDEAREVANELRKRLPAEYQVIVEKNHIHVECDIEQ